ncbi:maleylacetoacetate isomerase [Bradyrhizobium sp. U87765 SZCCT0131]|uniref:maleylacetoacetate isomerase n=1 Tax=unclassified Bradyrhizobium TaxID=2631580 RepID=UPI001BAAE7B6|nr:MULTISPECIES: maleylacetoacetate isomerase [unclassified Bradyrhizobium]MBR1218306.1 maleylacetoacetate isomerase [Bradyrhizobium sp. U87765 SZCCT0131]MBR1260748.1 maleylacetoacetate isomerase [Bradyrhizobium sp. U87765 SZCCT0134]MBR1303804.1 maleylacetoacetate isomerase [Bradyrhizobium sp. U87765 SZCCT0110]MBR1319410.1 maleylacetoacetate isomerase [Bradyrhizobium sp. U87765 SZCCT0109]MBR1347735.1 maleylacetoacetate isomerase [Bradyrhizobium sp. U87765 SZCCT0048]
MSDHATLYGYYRSTAAYRVRIALGLKGLSADNKFIHLRKGEQTGPEYLKVNPAGLVPYWIDGGFHLAQSLAIIEYLDETHPEPPLLPGNAEQRAIAREIAFTVASDIHPIGNLRVLNRLNQIGVDEPTRNAWSQHWIKLGFDAIEARLKELPGPFALGERPTLADICIVPQVFNARRFGLDLAPYARIRGIDAAAAKLEAFAAAEPGRQADAE